MSDSFQSTESEDLALQHSAIWHCLFTQPDGLLYLSLIIKYTTYMLPFAVRAKIIEGFPEGKRAAPGPAARAWTHTMATGPRRSSSLSAPAAGLA